MFAAQATITVLNTNETMPSASALRRGELAVFLALLGVMTSLLWGSADRLSVTTDETSHLPSGFSYWRTGDFRPNRQHPPLAKLVGALPLLFRDIRTDESWAYVRSAPACGSTFDYEWSFGDKLLYVDNHLAIDGGVAAGRRAMLPFAWLLVVAVWLGSRRRGPL